MGEITSDDLATPRKAKRHFNIAKEKVATQTKKIKQLQQSVRRYKAKVTNMQSLMKLLKQKLLLSENSEYAIMVSLQLC